MIKDLLEYWIQENLSEKLIDIRPDFYRRIREYILKLTMTELQDNNIVKNMKRKEREFIKRVVIDLLLIRLTKIFFLIRKGEEIDIDKLPLEEQNFFMMIKNEIDKLFQIKVDVSERRNKFYPISSKENMILIKFLKSCSKINISKTKILGPFMENDIAFLPKKIVEELIRKNIVKIIYMES